MRAELTTSEDRLVRLEAKFAHAFLQAPMVEHFGHVGRNSVSATPALLKTKSSETRRESIKKKTDIKEIPVLLEDEDSVTDTSQGVGGGQTGRRAAYDEEVERDCGLVGHVWE